MHTMEFYSAIKENEILLLAATQKDVEGIMLSEINQEKRQIVYDITYMQNLKNTTNQ